MCYEQATMEDNHGLWGHIERTSVRERGFLATTPVSHQRRLLLSVGRLSRLQEPEHALGRSLGLPAGRWQPLGWHAWKG